MKSNPIFKFIGHNGTFVVVNPQRYNLYFPLTDKDGRLLSCVAPNLAGDIKSDNDHFLTPPASILDLKNNLLCRRNFFLKIDNQYLNLSSPGAHDTLEAGLLYHKLIKKTRGLHIEILNFIPFDTAVEVMWIKVINTGRKEVSITPTSFIPLYGRSEKNLRDHRHVTSLLNRVKLSAYGVHLKPTMIFEEKGHTLNKMNYFVLGFENNGLRPVGQFPSIEYFCGEGDLFTPDAVYKNIAPVKNDLPEFDGKEACAGFRFKARGLKKNQEANYILIMGMSEDTQKINKIFLGLNSVQKIKKSLSETKNYWQGYLAGLKFNFKDKNYQNWFVWVKLQPVLRKLFGCSFLPHFDYGKGGRGWRDLWQDALTLLLSEPQEAKKIILKSFQGVRIDGSNATIIAGDGTFLADRNRISRVWMDHGVWPYLTLRAYLNKTEDLGILLKDAPYFRDQQIKRAQEIDKNFAQSDFIQRSNSGKIYQGSILEHILLQNLVQFFNVGIHNIIRLENADWNDGLDMAQERGESVAFSFMYAHNLADICILLESLKAKLKKVKLLKEIMPLLDSLNQPVDYQNCRAKQKRLEAYFKATKVIRGQRIEVEIEDLISDLSRKAAHLSGWLGKKEWLSACGFFNGYYDNRGLRVEGIYKGKAKIMLPSQVFAIMSGVASDAQVKKIWAALKKYLKDKNFGGFRLNTDFGGVQMDLGRAFGFTYGDKENGAFFNHMNVMLAYALYQRGFIKEAKEVMDSVYKMCLSPQAKIYPGLPEYFNAQGQGLYLYLTGSASWYVYTLALYCRKE